MVQDNVLTTGNTVSMADVLMDAAASCGCVQAEQPDVWQQLSDLLGVSKAGKKGSKGSATKKGSSAAGTKRRSRRG